LFLKLDRTFFTFTKELKDTSSFLGAFQKIQMGELQKVSKSFYAAVSSIPSSCSFM